MPSFPLRTRASRTVARGIYRGLPDDAQLWLGREEFVGLDREALIGRWGWGEHGARAQVGLVVGYGYELR